MAAQNAFPGALSVIRSFSLLRKGQGFLAGDVLRRELPALHPCAGAFDLPLYIRGIIGEFVAEGAGKGDGALVILQKAHPAEDDDRGG